MKPPFMVQLKDSEGTLYTVDLLDERRVIVTGANLAGTKIYTATSNPERFHLHHMISRNARGKDAYVDANVLPQGVLEMLRLTSLDKGEATVTLGGKQYEVGIVFDPHERRYLCLTSCQCY